MTLCFIPARGGSKRIPGKNSRLLGGRPLVAWTVSCAQLSEFDRIVVSSDDETILSIGESSGVESDRRPDALAGDRVRFVEVLEEYLRRPANAGKFERIAVLLPTTPFRTPADVSTALAMHATNPRSYVVSITAYEFPPQFACDFDVASAALTLRQPDVYAHSTQSQSVEPSYHPNGALYVGSVARLLETHSFFVSPVLGTVIPPERALDLDYPHQWPIAEALALQHQHA